MPFNFKGKKKAEWEAVKRKVPKLIAQDGVNLFLDNFKKQGFIDKPFKKWKPLSPAYAAQKRARKKGSQKIAILVETGALRRAVSNSIHKATWDKIEWRVKGIPYAKYHNEQGWHPNVHRPFMGNSKVLMKKIDKRIQKGLEPLFKGTS